MTPEDKRRLEWIHNSLSCTLTLINALQVHMDNARSQAVRGAYIPPAGNYPSWDEWRQDLDLSIQDVKLEVSAALMPIGMELYGQPPF